MSAPKEAVEAVQTALGCIVVPFGYHHWDMGRKAEWAEANSPTEGRACTCWLHQGDDWTERGCETAVAAADAAAPHIAAQTLRDAAEAMGEGDGTTRFIGMDPLPAAVRAEKRAQEWLRNRADRSAPCP